MGRLVSAHTNRYLLDARREPSSHTNITSSEIATDCATRKNVSCTVHGFQQMRKIIASKAHAAYSRVRGKSIAAPANISTAPEPRNTQRGWPASA